MKVVFLVFYNQYASGARCLAASALEAGHDAWLIKFKRFKSDAVPHDAVEERKALETSGHTPVFEIHPFFDYACPYPRPVTDQEREILYSTVERLAPDVVAFSLTSSHMVVIKEVSREIRRRFPSVKQIWGGIHPTMDPTGSLEFADAACVGEGEGALLDYLADPTRTDIQNLHIKRSDGSIQVNPRRPLITDMDSLPFPLYGERELMIEEDRLWEFKDLSYEEITDQLVISSQRGCPFTCSYCMHGVTRDMYKGERYLRRKSVDRFLDEIEDRVRRFGPTGLNFWDDVFMIHPPWIEEFSEKYPKRFNLPFGGYSHPRSTTPTMLRQLKKAGCVFVSVGIQSASNYISHEIYGRNVTAEQYIEFGRQLAEAGYDKLVYELLSRCPFEREEDLRETVHLLARMPHAFKVVIKQLVFFPFTRINTLDYPRVNLPLELYRFYEMLFLLAGQAGFDPALLDQLVDDPYLREHPDLVEQWVGQLEAANNQLEAKQLRIDQLEREMPWGIKRAAGHLVHQTTDWVRRKF